MVLGCHDQTLAAKDPCERAPPTSKDKHAISHHSCYATCLLGRLMHHLSKQQSFLPDVLRPVCYAHRFAETHAKCTARYCAISAVGLANCNAKRTAGSAPAEKSRLALLCGRVAAGIAAWAASNCARLIWCHERASHTRAAAGLRGANRVRHTWAAANHARRIHPRVVAWRRWRGCGYDKVGACAPYTHAAGTHTAACC